MQNSDDGMDAQGAVRGEEKTFLADCAAANGEPGKIFGNLVDEKTKVTLSRSSMVRFQQSTKSLSDDDFSG